VSARTRVIAQAIVDVVLVLLFAAIGRASHDHGVSPSGVLQTAWPFLIGALVGWCAARAWKAPHRVVPTGIIVWACTLVVGMILRVATGGGFAVSFLIVAGLFLALVLLGSRALVGLAARRSPAS
jgi:peptidoglycan/LPS O-acetylase OafA/YrhL